MAFTVRELSFTAKENLDKIICNVWRIKTKSKAIEHALEKYNDVEYYEQKYREEKRKRQEAESKLENIKISFNDFISLLK